MKDAPSRIALRCGLCGCFLTPCLVCARPVAAMPSDNDWKNCEYCGVYNPLNSQAREALGFPPPLALPSAMVRRVQSALIGRRSYSHLLTAGRTALEGEIFLKKSLPFCLLEKEGFVRPAKPSENQEARPALNTLENQQAQPAAASISDKEQQELIKCQGCGLIQKLDPSEKQQQTRVAEEVPPTQLELIQCNSQLVALNCCQALTDDFSKSSTTVELPICRVSPRWRVVTGSGIHCGAVQEFTHFSLKIMQLANEILINDSEGELKETLDETMAAAGKFLSRKQALQASQGSKCVSEEALKQACVDCKALAARTRLPLLESVLAAFARDNLDQQQESARRESEEFANLRSKINTILQILFQLSTKIITNPERRNAMQMTTTHLLLLYHDLAHVTMPST